MNRPNPTSGLRHVALNVHDIRACEHFYIDLMGMQEEWRPDPDNLYLTSGNDNLALHRAQGDFASPSDQRLDHRSGRHGLPERTGCRDAHGTAHASGWSQEFLLLRSGR